MAEGRASLPCRASPHTTPFAEVAEDSASCFYTPDIFSLGTFSGGPKATFAMMHSVPLLFVDWVITKLGSTLIQGRGHEGIGRHEVTFLVTHAQIVSSAGVV